VNRLNARQLERWLARSHYFTSKETHHLLSHHHHSFGGEPAVAVIEEILEGRAEKINDENVVKTLLSEVVDIGNSG
jgi:hypothetical protein